jgi:large subunit ribosomal protein L2
MGLTRNRNKISNKIQTFPTIKQLNLNLNKKAGRNNTGHISFFHRGGGVKKNFRLLDFKRLIWNIPAKVLRHEYDPFRNGFISLICYKNGILSYILTTDGLKINQWIINSNNKTFKLKVGNSTNLFKIPESTLIHSIEIVPGLGAKLIRSAGVFGQILKKNYLFGKILIKLPSKEQILINKNSIATIGIVSNLNQMLIKYYKAGQKRLLGFRPWSRGVAKNPIDHPHGGGGGRHLVTPWSKVGKNQRTRDKKKSNKFIIKNRKLFN